MTIVINFIGGCCVGKSLMSALTFAELKMRHLNVELVSEYAKNLVWQNKMEELNNQYTVSHEQFMMIKPLVNKVDYIVCDSGMLIGLFYNRNHKTNVSNVEKTEEMILSRMSELKNVYILLERNSEYPFTKEGRIQDELEAINIDKEMRELLEEFKLPYLSIISSKDSINNIVEYILS